MYMYCCPHSHSVKRSVRDGLERLISTAKIGTAGDGVENRAAVATSWRTWIAFGDRMGQLFRGTHKALYLLRKPCKLPSLCLHLLGLP